MINSFKHKSIFSVVFALILICCSQKDEIQKPVYVDFTMNDKSDKNGVPIDSVTSYFPEKLFTDTIPLEGYRDTFKIVTDSSYFRETSYMLFKMNEPVLSDHFLDKNIYRLIALRSFDLPLVVRIEKKGNTISIFSKKLNRHITYPFFKMLEEFVMFDPPGKKSAHQKKEFEEQYQIAKRENDSLRAAVNNTNYFLILDDKKEYDIAVWDSLEILVDTAKFWRTKPELCLNHQSIDGSRWFLEGHFQSGYQIKRIPSPHFSSGGYPPYDENDLFSRVNSFFSKYPNKYDEHNYYANIFRFLIEKAGLENEDLY